MKLQCWDVFAKTDDGKKLLGVVKTSLTADRKIAMAKASTRFAPDGFTIGFKLAVSKGDIVEA